MPHEKTKGASTPARIVVKKLPWLDGSKTQSTPSSITQVPSRKPSIATVPKQAPTSPLSTQRKPTISPSPRWISSVSGSSPSPAARFTSVKTSHQTPRLPDTFVQFAESPALISRVLQSPSQPVPSRGTLKRVGDRRISTAVEELEDLVQQAVEIAEDLSNQDQIEEIQEIIEEARHALQDTSGHTEGHLMSRASPLEASSDTSDTSGTSSVLDAPVHHSHASKPRGSVSFDWAYPDQKGQVVDLSSTTSSTSSNDQDDVRSRSRMSTQSDHLLPPPRAQTSPRDHVDRVVRSAIRAHSPKQVRRRPTDDSASPNQHQRERYRARRERTTSSGSSQLDTSFDEGELPAKAYGNELRVREQAQYHTYNLRRKHHRQPIARNWPTGKKRLTAIIACINTSLLGILIGIYAGEVPRIQYYLADEKHIAIVGNAVLYFALALSTFVVWPLPLFHGRKPYLLAALALAMPLQFPQAVVVGSKRSPNDAKFRTGLLCARAASGLVLGFANVNYITILLDLFGASLQSKNPHQEFVVPNDVRRHGGGMGIWLGIWSWCWIGSLAIGFQIGTVIIEKLSPDWGFYIIVIILAGALVLNIIAPETRRATYRKSVTEVYDYDENFITRRVSRGEVKLHISTEGPLYWFEEVWAGMKLMAMMLCQPGFLVLSFYVGWIYAQIVLVIILLGSLLSRDYKWQPRFVGAGVTSIAVGAVLAIPLTKAGIFSRERKKAFRTDSMTFQKQVTWSSHLLRRAIFTLTLPLMGLAYTVSAAGAPKPYMVPIVFAGAVGFLSILATAECYGLIMETFDTCDLQAGVNTRHRVESMAVEDRRRRTNYTSFPRVTAGIFASQILAFIGAGVATMVGGSMTRNLGAQASTGVTAGILLGLTILLTLVLWRFKEVQVIPNHTFGTRRDTAAWQDFKELEKMGRGADWKAVVIGNPSGKMRKVSVLELGSLSRWTEIRKLNFLLKGPRLGQEEPRRRTIRGSW
ncbi:MFS general substrate transporter [Pyrenochaeta sp. DS3sAY3a]|nr:MFS general substrate transporter [Pyrenochaeta sp. DS3sAY3a]